MEVQDWLPIVISALSFAVSAFTFYLQRRSTRELIKVTGSVGFTVTPISEPTKQILVEAANVGDRPVTLSSFGLRMPDKRVLVLPFAKQHVQLPYELLPGKSCTMCMPVHSAVEALVNAGYKNNVLLVPQFSAQSGAKFSGKAFDFNVQAWAK